MRLRSHSCGGRPCFPGGFHMIRLMRKTEGRLQPLQDRIRNQARRPSVTDAFHGFGRDPVCFVSLRRHGGLRERDSVLTPSGATCLSTFTPAGRSPASHLEHHPRLAAGFLRNLVLLAIRTRAQLVLVEHLVPVHELDATLGTVGTAVPSPSWALPIAQPASA